MIETPKDATNPADAETPSPRLGETAGRVLLLLAGGLLLAAMVSCACNPVR